MKQPGLDKLRDAINEILNGKGDPLNLVNAFMKTRDEDDGLLNEYWTHRFCALAEMLDGCVKSHHIEKTKKVR